MDVTKHAQARISERMGVGKSDKKTERAAKLALSRGIKHEQTKGDLKKYLDRKWESHKNGNNMRVYANHIWIFHNEMLLTVIPLPSKFISRLSDYIKEDKDAGREMQGT